MALKVALQLYSVRDDMAKDYVATLEAVAEMGYHGVEFAGFVADPAEMGAKARELGMEPISCHYNFGKILENPEKAFNDCLAAGCKFIVIPWLGRKKELSDENLDATIAEIARVGKMATEAGLTMLYHNHDFEFDKVNGEYIIDKMYREIPADALKTQLDTCWVNVGGENPANFVRKYAGRAPLVHIKDFTGSKSEGMYELIGDDKTVATAKVEQFRFRPVGYGVQDVPAILKASEEAGAGWVIVEQDQSPDMPPIEAVKLSRDYLKSLGV